MRESSSARAAPYLLALVAVGLAAAIRFALDPWLRGEYLFTLSYGAVAIALWAGGYRPAIVASLLAYAIGAMLFVHPQLSRFEHALALFTYLLDCGVIIAVGEALRHAWTQAQRGRDFLDLAVKAANMNTFSVDLDGEIATRSNNALSFYGLAELSERRDDFLSRIHPEDRQRHLDAIRQSRLSGEDFLSRFRFIRPDGQGEMWIEAHGRVVRDKAGRQRLIGAALNITERVTLERKVAEHAAALDQASRRKSDFIAMLAHELRNPVTPIKTCLSVMRQRASDEKTRQFALDVIGRQTARIERLVEELLDVSRIEQGKIELRLERVDVARIVQKAAEASLPHIEAKSQHLSIRLPQAPMWVRADEERIVQVVNNLLNNSCKFTPSGKSIALHVAPEDGWVRVRVKDDGIGIAGEQLNAIFGSYFQVGAEAGGRNPGLGLGLALSKALVEAHGGCIEAHSDGVGMGSEFTVSLPDPSYMGPQEHLRPVSGVCA